MCLVDSHCHLNHPVFSNDLPQVVAHAREAGIAAIVNVGYDLLSSQTAIQQAATYSVDGFIVVATIGLHPHHADQWDHDLARKLRALARDANVVAVGECGLDFYRSPVSPAVQEKAFQGQLEVAALFNLPVVLHIRDAYQEVLRILDQFGHQSLCGVAHCFTGTEEDAWGFLEKGFFIGLTGIVTHPKKSDLVRQVAAKLPMERLLVETDAPYIAPHPYRGKRNEPANLSLIVQEVARVRSLPTHQVARLTAENAQRLFNLLKKRNGQEGLSLPSHRGTR
ncbi:MAG: TatD family hydrolase [Armatimonadetes bacterium]|nr:TatD family hydrolase [Armatimonadota bacterium]MDW8121880.1 TatD family hydrolase [Armatimonadota bacterium]